MQIWLYMVDSLSGFCLFLLQKLYLFTIYLLLCVWKSMWVIPQFSHFTLFKALFLYLRCTLTLLDYVKWILILQYYNLLGYLFVFKCLILNVHVVIVFEVLWLKLMLLMLRFYLVNGKKGMKKQLKDTINGKGICFHPFWPFNAGKGVLFCGLRRCISCNKVWEIRYPTNIL